MEVTLTVFKSPIASCQYAFKNGTYASFINHLFHTTDPDQVEELLKAERATGIKKASAQDLQVVDDNPVEVFRARMRQELLTELKEQGMLATKRDRDLGETVIGPMTMVTSASGIDTAMASNGAVLVDKVQSNAQLVPASVKVNR